MKATPHRGFRPSYSRYLLILKEATYDGWCYYALTWWRSGLACVLALQVKSWRQFCGEPGSISSFIDLATPNISLDFGPIFVFKLEL